jgi:hypothetical protein
MFSRDFIITSANMFDTDQCDRILYIAGPNGLSNPGTMLKEAFQRVSKGNVRLIIEAALEDKYTFEKGVPDLDTFSSLCEHYLEDKEVDKPVHVILQLAVARGGNVAHEEFGFVALPKGKDKDGVNWAERGQEAFSQSLGKVKGFLSRNK